MKTKHTQEYAFKMVQKVSTEKYISHPLSFVEGYMKAVEETAAPKLLEALQDLVWLIEHYATTEELLNSINAKSIPAIKKAQGE